MKHILLTSLQFASYWNAFLFGNSFEIFIPFKICIKQLQDDTVYNNDYLQNKEVLINPAGVHHTRESMEG